MELQGQADLIDMRISIEIKNKGLNKEFRQFRPSYLFAKIKPACKADCLMQSPRQGQHKLRNRCFKPLAILGHAKILALH